MNNQNSDCRIVARWTGLALVPVLSVFLFPWRADAVGYWTALENKAPDSVQLMLLLSDGTVMAANNPCDVFGGKGQDWYRLTPDISGGYANGTWTSLASMHDTRLFYSSAVLPDGRVFIAGGEYGSGRATAEMYYPFTDTWTQINPPVSLLDPNAHSPVLAALDETGNQGFLDSGCVVLPDGRVLVAPVAPNTRGGTLVYDPAANTWSAGPMTRSSYQDEASWVKLPDDSILTIDPFGTNTERYIPALNQWIADQPVPTPLYSPVGGEMGPAFLLPDGRAFFLGGSGHTAYYTPSGGISQGTWTIGPDIPGGLTASDSPAAMMANGKILCAVAPPPYLDGGKTQFPTPTSFFEFDPVANAFERASGPTGTLNDDIPSYLCTMLDLPDGTVLYCHVEQGNVFYSGFGSQLYLYHPDGAPLAAGKPTLTSSKWNPDASLHLTGKLFNGISQGAAFGDDAQMDSNYPLARFINSRGSVWYGRTFNWSSTSVMTGNRPATTEVGRPWYLAPGWYSLTVVANGISSDPIPFYGPVWVDFNSFAVFPDGSFDQPYWTVTDGGTAVDAGGTIAVMSGLSHEKMTISKPMTIIAVDGPVTIGQ